jgi:hypothetical protein
LANTFKGSELLQLADKVKNGQASAADWVTLLKGTSSVAGNSACHWLAHNGGCGRKDWGVSYQDSHTQVCTVGSSFT